MSSSGARAVGSGAPMLIRRKDPPRQSWRSPEIDTYDDEAALQALLAESPRLLGLGNDVAVVRELTVPGIGSLDIAAVSSSGAIMLVECKLASNPEIRRSVVGQVLAYAAGLWSLSYNDFDDVFAAKAHKPLDVAIAEAAQLGSDWDQDAFRAAVTANLETGRFDLVIAVDSITEELKRIVRYLNEHTVSEIRVLALELGYVSDGDVELLLPTIYGEESATRKQQSSRRTWDERSLFEFMETRGEVTGAAVLRRLYDHVLSHDGQMVWGGGELPSVTAYYPLGEVKASVWSCYTRENGGSSWDVNFEWMRNRKVPEAGARAVGNTLARHRRSSREACGPGDRGVHEAAFVADRRTSHTSGIGRETCRSP